MFACNLSDELFRPRRGQEHGMSRHWRLRASGCNQVFLTGSHACSTLSAATIREAAMSGPQPLTCPRGRKRAAARRGLLHRAERRAGQVDGQREVGGGLDCAQMGPGAATGGGPAAGIPDAGRRRESASGIGRRSAQRGPTNRKSSHAVMPHRAPRRRVGARRAQAGGRSGRPGPRRRRSRGRGSLGLPAPRSLPALRGCA